MSAMNSAHRARRRPQLRVPHLFLLLGLAIGWMPSARGAVATATTLTASATSVPAKTPITLTAKVTTGGQPVSAGQVEWCDATAKFCEGSAVLAQAQLVGNTGAASIKLILAPGSHSIKALYAGTGPAASNLSSSVSSPVTVSITGGQPTATTLVAAGNAGNYTLTSETLGFGTTSLNGINIPFYDGTDGDVLLGSAPLGASKTLQFFQAAFGGTTGDSPVQVAVGDFNGDGKPDAATVNLNSSTISILLGNGNATFTVQPSPLETEPDSNAIVAGDFNNDGNLDLAVTSVYSNTVGIFLGDGKGNFTPFANFPAGLAPVSLATGDFNRDGQLDLAVVDQDGMTVTILFGGGNGSFTPAPQAPPTGYHPTSIVVGDLNGDGIPDLAVANMYANNMTLLFGKGDGTFTSAGTLATGVYPSAVAMGDFNGDGKTDLAVTNSYSQTVTIYLGNGAGGFNAQSAEPATDKNPVSITVADLNNDGIQDLAVASPQSNAVDIYFGKGDGTFAPETVVAAGNSPYSVVAADVSGDGDEDIVVSDALGNEVQTIINNIETSAIASIKGIAAPGQPIQNLLAIFPGNAIYAASTSATVQVMGTLIPTTTAISVGSPTVGITQSVQITGIVTPSTVGLTAAGGQASLYDGPTLVGTQPVIKGVTYFSLAYSAPGNHVYSIHYAGDANFAGSNSGAAAVEVVPVAFSQTTLTSSATSVAHGTVVTLTATVTSNGKPVTPGTVNFCRATAAFCEDVAILRSAQLTANGTATVKLALPVGANAIKAVFVGTGEVATSVSATRTVTVTGTYPVSIALSESGSAGDYTLVATLTGGSWQSMPNPLQLIDTSNHNLLLQQDPIVPQLLSLTPKAPMPVILGPYAVVTGDFNGDGKMDAAVASPKTGALEILLGNGDGTFTAKPSSLNFDEVAALVAGDFNGDGNLDLAVCDSQDGLVEILLGNGDGTFTLKVQISTRGGGPEAMVAGDFNSDGKLDLAVVNTISNTIVILLGNGDGTFTVDPALIGPTSLSNPFSIVTADFDGDGHPDLAVANHNNVVIILYGNGDGSFTLRENSFLVYPILVGSLPGNSGLGAIAVGDFNGDGKPDLAVPNNQGLGITLNRGNGNFASEQRVASGNHVIGNIMVADLNGDGFDDLVMSDYTDSTLILNYSIGAGVYNQTATSVPISNGLGLVAAADFDQDGGQDLLVNEYGAGAAEVFLNRSIDTSTFSKLAVPGSGNHLLEATLAAEGPYNAAVSNTVTALGTPVQAGALIRSQPGSNIRSVPKAEITAPVTH
jgi:hypothetical protein